MEQYLAIDNVCAWPNIKQLDNGEILAFIFNQPCHLLWEGTIACHVSSDQGRSWQFRSFPVVNAPGTNRGNVAAGISRAGKIVVLCGGWDNAAPAPGGEVQGDIGDDRIKYRQRDKRLLLPVCSISADQGRSWEVRDITLLDVDGSEEWVPYGDIITLANGDLACSMYACVRTAGGGGYQGRGTYFWQSSDGGLSWHQVSRIAEDGGETALILLPGGKIYAAVRKQRLDLYESVDEGRSWRYVSQLTGMAMYPGAFTLLSDGHLLLTYGIRYRGLYGIGGMTMHLASGLWNTPMYIVDLADAYDGGYPSNIQLADGRILTAYYCSPNRQQRHYHMGTVIWSWQKFFPPPKK
ncbi:MAG: exo-alpha-sialidase [Lentisphaerae bacterium]|nr:exo-alpha-sialidase [Lentisphaerota bacterium]